MSVHITYRGSINSATVASNTVVNKNAPLTNSEIDGNFKSIQDEMNNFTVNAAQAQFTPTQSITSTNIQAALIEVDGKIQNKQGVLVSGNNIKTIDGESILGSGNLSLKTVGGESIIGPGAITFKKIDNIDIVGTGNITVSTLKIVDSSTSSTGDTWSAKKINDSILAASSGVKNDLLGGAGPAFDTLKELSDALANGTGLEVTLTNEISSKQDILVESGTGANFKTIENQSLLGSGNIDLVSIDGTSLIGSSDIKFKTVGGAKIIGTGDIPIAAGFSFNDDGTSSTDAWSAEKIISEMSKVTPSSTNITTVAALQEMSYDMNITAETTIDLSKASVYFKTIPAGTTTFTFSNPASAGFVSTFIVELKNTQGVAPTVNWPASVKWQDGAKPKLTANSTDIFGFYTRDGGLTYRGLTLSKNSA